LSESCFELVAPGFRQAALLVSDRQAPSGRPNTQHFAGSFNLLSIINMFFILSSANLNSLFFSIFRLITLCFYALVFEKTLEHNAMEQTDVKYIDSLHNR